MNRCADSGLDRDRRQSLHIPVDPEVVGGDPRREGRDRQASRHTLLRASVDPDTAGFQVRRNYLPERIPPQTRLERHRDAQPGETKRDVRRAATRMRGQCPASALPDQVDERLTRRQRTSAFPHSTRSMDSRAPAHGRPGRRRSRHQAVPDPPSSQTRNEIQRLTLGVRTTNQRSGAPSLPRGHHQASTRPA